MSPQLPSFLRRRMRLSEARRELLAGHPEGALRALDDSVLEGVEEALVLRERVLDLLCRQAARLVPGRYDEAERLLALVDERDPSRSRAWRQRLEQESVDRASVSGLRPGAEQGLVRAMQDLLGELRDGDARGPEGRADGPGAETDGASG